MIYKYYFFNIHERLLSNWDSIDRREKCLDGNVHNSTLRLVFSQNRTRNLSDFQAILCRIFGLQRSHFGQFEIIFQSVLLLYVKMERITFKLNSTSIIDR